jgi:hypothetical protein
METLDIQLHLSNINWEDGYSPCKSLKPLIQSKIKDEEEGQHMVSKNKTVLFIPHEICDHIPSLVNLHMSHHGPKEGPFTSIPLKYKSIHLHIPHYSTLIWPFLELTTLGSVVVLAVSPSHCSDGQITSSLPT